jgi:carbamoyl-phosphate synthase large subunit
VLVGCHDSRFILKKSEACRNYLLPVSTRSFPTALRGIIEAERIDLVIPTSDADVLTLSKLRTQLGCETFLPHQVTIERCQDKYALTNFLRRRGIPAPRTYPITDLDSVEPVFRRFRSGATLWCRIRIGSGSQGAIPVKTPDQVRSWIAYWERMRGVPPESFTLAEYLPGRDFCVQCLWNKGVLVLAKMAERITYLPTGSPSGVSSMPALAKTVFEPHIVRMCSKAIRAVDAKASGVFFVDVKESDKGEPCITEINAGRFSTMTNIHDLAGAYNTAVTFVRLALGERIRIPASSDFAEGYYLVRSVDTLPMVIRREELFQGIEASG